MFAIKTGVPLGKSNGRRVSEQVRELTDTMKAMHIGDCFDIPVKAGTNEAQNHRNNISKVSKKTGIVIATRYIKGENILRCWRVERTIVTVITRGTDGSVASSTKFEGNVTRI